MTRKEFNTIALTLKAAYPALKSFDTDEGIKVWYEMLKDLDFLVAADAAAICIRESPYPPTVADIRSASRKIMVPDWSVEWNKLLKGVKYSDLNSPAQYALKTLTEEYMNEMMDSREKAVWCMKEFEKLYSNYFKLTRKDKETLLELGMWQQYPDDRIGSVPMQYKPVMTLPDGRIVE